MRSKGDLSLGSFVAYGQQVGLRDNDFRSCIEAHRFKAQIEKSSADALALGLSGTPTFILGRTTPGDFSGDVLTGAVPFSAFENAIRRQTSTK